MHLSTITHLIKLSELIQLCTVLEYCTQSFHCDSTESTPAYTGANIWVVPKVRIPRCVYTSFTSTGVPHWILWVSRRQSRIAYRKYERRQGGRCGLCLRSESLLAEEPDNHRNVRKKY